MDNLICTECGMTYYSAAAGLMVERGERCDCGAPLGAPLGRRDDFGRTAVGVVAGREGNGSPAPPRNGHSVRRFRR